MPKNKFFNQDQSLLHKCVLYNGIARRKYRSIIAINSMCKIWQIRMCHTWTFTNSEMIWSITSPLSHTKLLKRWQEKCI